MGTNQARARALSNTEQIWCHAVSSGTGITVLALQMDRSPSEISHLHNILQKLQKSHPLLVSKLHYNPTTKDWDTLVVSVSNSAPHGDLTLQVVKDCLLNEESRRKEQAFNTEQNALVTENSDRRGRNKNRGPQHQRDKSKGKSKFKGDFKCHYCGGPNHYERHCRKKKRDQKDGNNENKKDDKDTTTVATDGDVVIICDDACVSSSCQETDWIIDSGASYHITPHRDMFTSYTSGNFGRVRMANHGVTEVIGMGNINLETDTGCRLILRDIRHISDIRLNIISTGKLDDDGYVSNFGEGKWKLTKCSLITAKGKKKNSLYLMQAKLSNGKVNAAVNSFSIELWHKRLGHLSQKGMQLLAKKKLLPDVNGIELQTCVDCLAGKQHRVAFKSFYLERRESSQEVPDDLDPVPSRTTQDHEGNVQGEQNDITDDEPVNDQVPPIQTDDLVPPPEATGCKSRGIKLFGPLAAAVLIAAHSTKLNSDQLTKKKYGVATLIDCRPLLEPVLSTHHFGFFYSAIFNIHTLKGTENLWDLAERIYTDFARDKKSNKRFSDMTDINFLMRKAIENPSVSVSSSLRTAIISGVHLCMGSAPQSGYLTLFATES
ncbi:hypothetical protein BUALT_Bualt09G0095500 [Buddleja alternifolia]|uniref:GAG-pre-integrase domain-containing protein n=1 Tax=Buddleja alternifolia TaxID=168488 RepID=A0AAV6X2N3_9LAMI|nr:hypothetical protein BUALT_Bualt09G0095500 [Buddleja alternifolia]